MDNKDTKRLLIKANVLKKDHVPQDEINKHDPKQIIEIDGYSYTVEELSDEDTNLRLLANQTIYLKSIKNILIFFLIAFLIGFAINLIYTFKVVDVFNSIL